MTAIIVKSVDAGDWFAGGKSLAEQKLASYWIDIHVGEGTNTRTRRRPISPRCWKRMAEILGPLHHETYLHVDEVKGDAYGFGGLTQERRYIAGKARSCVAGGVKSLAAGEESHPRPEAVSSPLGTGLRRC